MTGGPARFAYYMAEPGVAKIKVYTAAADLAAVIEERKDAGAQSSTLDVVHLRHGALFLRYHFEIRFRQGREAAAGQVWGHALIMVGATAGSPLR